nr:hypothetical protein CFP56_09900 [Quercus suber]
MGASAKMIETVMLQVRVVRWGKDELRLMPTSRARPTTWDKTSSTAFPPYHGRGGDEKPKVDHEQQADQEERC